MPEIISFQVQIYNVLHPMWDITLSLLPSVEIDVITVEGWTRWYSGNMMSTSNARFIYSHLPLSSCILYSPMLLLTTSPFLLPPHAQNKWTIHLVRLSTFRLHWNRWWQSSNLSLWFWHSILLSLKSLLWKTCIYIFYA